MRMDIILDTHLREFILHVFCMFNALNEICTLMMITQNNMPTSEYDPRATLYEMICTHRRLQCSRKNETQISRDRYEVTDRIARYNLPSYTTTEMWHHWEKLIRFDKIGEERIYPLGRRTHWKKNEGIEHILDTICSMWYFRQRSMHAFEILFIESIKIPYVLKGIAGVIHVN